MKKELQDEYKKLCADFDEAYGKAQQEYQYIIERIRDDYSKGLISIMARNNESKESDI